MSEKKLEGAGLRGQVAGKTSLSTVGKAGKGLTYRGYPIEILSEDISLDDLVSSYLLNSQLITVKNNEMMMLLPEEVQNHSNCMRWLEEIKSSSPIKHIEFVDIRQSMMNGGGPACLRFKITVNNDEFNQINEKFLLTPKKLMDL